MAEIFSTKCASSWINSWSGIGNGPLSVMSGELYHGRRIASRASPMKLIFSRKGFDSKYGGCASPIFEDRSLCSLPIPDQKSRTCYGDIRFDGESIAPMVETLTRGRISASAGAHLDPDLRRESMRRAINW